MNADGFYCGSGSLFCTKLYVQAAYSFFLLEHFFTGANLINNVANT